MGNPRKDITNKRFGRLVAKKRIFSTKKNRYVWVCLCDCGTEKEIRLQDFSQGTVSCGCLKKETAKNSKTKTKGTAAFNLLFNSYKSGAKRRGLEFNIDKEHFRYLTQCHCFYCGLSPSNFMKTKTSNGGYRYSGIDRIHNKIGYTKENAVPSCKTCNQSKRDMKYEEFSAWLDRLTIFRNSSNNKLVNDQKSPENFDNAPCVFNLVMDDVLDRTNQGIKKYGMPLKVNNKRDSLIDAYQESLDLVFYLRQQIEEKKLFVEFLKTEPTKEKAKNLLEQLGEL